MKDFANIESYLSKDEEGRKLLEDLNALKSQKRIFSDLYTLEDGEELQYVQVVQEGGCTLGLSLVGFCFVMEYLGIRFLKLAGTSAGAINTLFMAALGQNKNEPVTPKLFHILNQLDMFSFVDGHWLARAIIKSIISKDHWFITTIIVYAIVILLLIFFFPLVRHYGYFAQFFYWLFLSVFILFTALIVFLYYRFKRARYGINPGNEFLKFLKSSIGDITKMGLDHKAKFEIDETSGIAVDGTYHFKLRNRKNISEEIDKTHQYFKGLESDYAFITSDIISERKVQLPLQAGLYWEDTDMVSPAEFVRASMAIPLFFEPLIKNINRSSPSIVKNWQMMYIEPDAIPEQGIFIDGGSISNFPISIFHNSSISTPRLPLIGIRIIDNKPTTKKEIKSLYDYGMRIINTLRNHYDNEFLTKNNFYEKYSIAKINTYETKANWLDFNLSDKYKRALVLKGVSSAIAFLSKFNWEEYKSERSKIASKENGS